MGKTHGNNKHQYFLAKLILYRFRKNMSCKRVGIIAKFIISVLLIGFSQVTYAATVVNLNSKFNESISKSIWLEAGTYQITSNSGIGGNYYDAWNPWNQTTCNQPDGCERTWSTTVKGWINAYQVESPSITTVIVDGKALFPVDTEPYYEDKPAPYVPPFESFFVSSATKNLFRVEDGFCYPTKRAAFDNAQVVVFAISQSENVKFYLWDTNLIDNDGGISLTISPVPIPSAVWLLGAGLGVLAMIQRKTKC